MNQTERRKFLIKKLLLEEPNVRNIEIPTDPEQQKLLLRAMMNLRLPKEMDEKFLTIQDEYLKNEARIKALEAIKNVIESGNISTPASDTIEQEEEISKRATNMVKAEDFDQNFKNNVNKKILDDFRNDKKELLKQDAIQKKEFIEQGKKNLEELDKLKKLEEPEGIKLLKKSKELEDKKEENLYDDFNNIESNNLNNKNDISDEDDISDDNKIIK